jgi:hypothetical protein
MASTEPFDLSPVHCVKCGARISGHVYGTNPEAYPQCWNCVNYDAEVRRTGRTGIDNFTVVTGAGKPRSPWG